MRPRRATLNALLATASVVILASCQQPAPGVTVFSGTSSAHREAICWSFEPTKGVEKADCSLELDTKPAGDIAQTLLDEIAVIPTTPGETVGISVDAAAAENGWLVSINGRSLTRDPVTEKYFRFTMPPQPLRAGDAQLVVQALTEDGTQIRGSWLFGLSDGRPSDG